ncbi:phage portal protein [Sodalis ligni]|uniref:HK97 family phage portal protein n=1 Tax=Sodalis ligni TaxID=2697027 RepID=A0A4R1NGR6_9GAMM|nr:phage portal protein [Sodalis ligni]TCL06904.1 HK97 family phage portal protein [Sodalis ligni]
MWNPFRRKEKALMAPANNSGWFSLILEPFSGAWQRNIKVDRRSVLAYHAVFSCISLIANDIAKMPIRLMSKDSNGIWKERSSNSISVLKKPNAFQTRIQFYENWLISKLAWGNTYILIIRNNSGQIIEFRVLDPQRVQPLVSDDGDVFYQIGADNMAGLENEIIVPAREIIHDRFNCLYHPLVGLSPIYACGLSAMQGLHIQENSAAFFKNGGKPSGVIKYPGSISEEKAKEIKAAWDTGYSGENSGKTAILSGGADYIPVSMTAADAQTVEQLKMTAEIVCSVYHVPAYKVGVGSVPTQSNIEALELQYYSQCLQTHIESIETLMDEALDLEVNTGAEFDIDVLLRMDTQGRFATYKTAVGSAVMSPNEARRKENLSPVPGGDNPYLQQQNYSLEALARRDAQDNPFANATSQAQPAQSNDDDEAESKALTHGEMYAAKAMLKGIFHERA